MTETMKDARARKRLKQKAAERWENEGGRIELPQDQKDSSAERKTKEKRPTDRRRKKPGAAGKKAS